MVLGPSGSGKSTLLDGHASLLTPPRWLDFNTAARASEKGVADRSLVTYVRGAYANKTSEEGEKVKRYLREGTTWSAICETYRDGTQRTVVLGRLLWIKGNGSSNSDVHPLYFTCEREFSLRELQVLPQTGFDVRKLKASLPDVWFTDEFSGYQTRFMRLFSMASDRALRLLHKTQSAKDLGDLNRFLRDFMLDAPETFEAAEKLVTEFAVLDGAHQSVLQARNQIDALKPAREALAEHTRHKSELLVLAEERVGINYFREQTRKRLLEARIAEQTVNKQAFSDKVTSARAVEQQELSAYEDQQATLAGAGGNILGELEGQLRTLTESRLPEVQVNESRLMQAATALEWPVPNSPETFAQAQSRAHEVLGGRKQAAEAQEAELDALKKAHKDAEDKFALLINEVKALENRTSNMPVPLLSIRERMCRDLGLGEDEVPFAGELLQVKASEAKWAGALERVLHNFSTSMLVEEALYKRVAAWVDQTDLRGRLVYLRLSSRAAQPVAQPPANSLLRKLDFSPKHRDWLSEELRARFDYACVQTSQELQAVERGVTLAGQVKHSRTRHEKDDRTELGNRKNWVLGFSNLEKLQALKDEAAELAPDIENKKKAVVAARLRNEQRLTTLMQCQALVNLIWESCNLVGVLEEQRRLNERIAREKQARPDLEEMRKTLDRLKRRWEKATEARQEAERDFNGCAEDIKKSARRLQEIPAESLSVLLTPTQEEGLSKRFAGSGKTLSLDSLDSIANSVVQGMHSAELNAAHLVAETKSLVEKHLQNFCVKWPTDAKGLDASIEAAPEFMSKLERLETDGLHQYVTRFKALLREQSDQNLAVLHTRLDQERRSIQDRLDQVNESLRRCRFDENTYLHIDWRDKPPQQVVEFRQQLKAALDNSFKEDDENVLEERFAQLNAVVQRLGSQSPENIKWRNLVLDVRLHVEFSALEFDDTGMEVERHDSGSGKSGGQRQKLATTCLAAALKYQLAGEEGDWPTFCTVVMDEAFDHTDNEYTAMVMTIFNDLGFQVVAATPVKNVMALEPFIGGGTFVSIQNRRFSEALSIRYDTATQRLDLSLAAQEMLSEELEATGEADEPV